jgi:mRNA-degrading endonuclease toxin of MazEF toxin-antitoxin module
MKPWEIWECPFPWGPHPAVIISNAVRVARKEEVVILSCRTMQPVSFREPVETECLLDESDGMNWKTICRCDLLYTIKKSTLRRCLGEVVFERRRDIARKIQQGLAIAGL